MPTNTPVPAPQNHKSEEDTKSLKVMFMKVNLEESEHDLLIEHVDGNYYTIPNLPKLTLSQKIKIIRDELEESRIRKNVKPLQIYRKFIEGEGDQHKTATDKFKANIEALKRVNKDMEKLKQIYSIIMKKLNDSFFTSLS